MLISNFNCEEHSNLFVRNANLVSLTCKKVWDNCEIIGTASLHGMGGQYGMGKNVLLH